MRPGQIEVFAALLALNLHYKANTTEVGMVEEMPIYAAKQAALRADYERLIVKHSLSKGEIQSISKQVYQICEESVSMGV